MVEIRYKESMEDMDIAGQTVHEARELHQKGFKISGKAAAYLNGKKINPEQETKTVLNDEDSLEFKAGKVNRLVYMFAAMMIAMAITGGVFAYGFTNATATINTTTVASDFASVSANNTSTPSWTVRGMQKNSTGSGSLFDINTTASGYTGDLVATVTLANADELIGVYRNLTLVLELRDHDGDLISLDGSESNFALLTLENGSAQLSFAQLEADTYTVLLKNGSFIANAAQGWGAGTSAPMLYCEVAQR